MRFSGQGCVCVEAGGHAGPCVGRQATLHPKNPKVKVFVEPGPSPDSHCRMTPEKFSGLFKLTQSPCGSCSSSPPTPHPPTPVHLCSGFALVFPPQPLHCPSPALCLSAGTFLLPSSALAPTQPCQLSRIHVSSFLCGMAVKWGEWRASLEHRLLWRASVKELIHSCPERNGAGWPP